MELWKEYPGSKEYLISSYGRVKTAKTGRILTPCVDARGYERIALFKHDRNRRFKVHRLVAETYIPNTENKPQVNHKDGNKRNNRVDNLEWATNAENFEHSVQNDLRKGHREYCENKKVAVVATNVQNGEEIYFDSITAAKVALKTNHVQEVLKGKREQAKGFTFRYAEGGEAVANINHRASK